MLASKTNLQLMSIVYGIVKFLSSHIFAYLYIPFRQQRVNRGGFAAVTVDPAYALCSKT